LHAELTAAENVSGGQLRQAVEPSEDHLPAGQAMHVLLFLLPAAAEYVPPAQGCGIVRLPLQKKPAAHCTHDAEQLEKKKPGAHP
jgi:hypothetical protein